MTDKMKFREWYKLRHGVEYADERAPGTRIDEVLAKAHEALADWADLVAEGKVPDSALSLKQKE